MRKFFKRLLLYISAFFILLLAGKDHRLEEIYQKKLDQI